MTTNHSRLAALAAALAFTGGIAGLSVASAKNAARVASPSATTRSLSDNDVETNDDGLQAMARPTSLSRAKPPARHEIRAALVSAKDEARKMTAP